MSSNGFYLWYLDAVSSYQVRKMWDSHNLIQFDVSILFAEKTLHFCQYLVFVAKIYDDASLATLTYTNDSI